MIRSCFLLAAFGLGAPGYAQTKSRIDWTRPVVGVDAPRPVTDDKAPLPVDVGETADDAPLDPSGRGAAKSLSIPVPPPCEPPPPAGAPSAAPTDPASCRPAP